MRIPIVATAVSSQGSWSGEPLRESTVIEFGTPHEVLFISSMPLEFGDAVRLENADGSLRIEAAVVAVQYDSGKTAVGVRFTRKISNWIIKA